MLTKAAHSSRPRPKSTCCGVAPPDGGCRGSIRGAAGEVLTRVFEVEAYNYGIVLNNEDMKYVISNFSDKSNPLHIFYEDALKIIVPIMTDQGKM